MKWLMLAMLVVVASRAHATVTQYSNNSAAWESAVGDFTTIDFTGYPQGTFITNQYEALGILFTDGQDVISQAGSYHNDGWGLTGAFQSISVAFDSPQSWIGVHFPGIVQFKLYNEGQLLYTSSEFDPPGIFGFAGLASTVPFDAATIFDPSGNVNIDDLHFGPPIPGPGALTLLTLAALSMRSRRRSN